MKCQNMQMMLIYQNKMAKLLTDKGVLVGLENSGAMERMNTRNLPSSWNMCCLRPRQRAGLTINHF
jgi:hypothetical protein